MTNTLESGEFGASSFLAKLPPSELECLVRAFQSRQYGNGEVIFSEGNPCAGLYAIRHGTVKLMRSSGDKDQILALVGAGDLIDPVPLLDGGPHTCTGKARGPVSLLYINNPAATDLIWNRPRLLTALMNDVGAQLRLLCAQVTDLAFKDVAARVGQWVLSMGRLDGRQEADGIHFVRTLSQAELAALIGTGREVIWRVLKKFEDDGLIKVERHEISILDPDRLASIVER